RSYFEMAAAISGEAVRGSCVLAGRERRHQEACRAATSVEGVGQRNGRRALRGRGQREVDSTFAAYLEALAQVGGRRERRPTRPHPEVRRDQQDGGRDGEHCELYETQQPRSQIEPDGRPHERPAPARDHQLVRATGTGTDSRIVARTSAVLTPRIIAS